MTITTKMNGTSLDVVLVGRLDTETAPKLEKELSGKLNGVEELTLDLKDLEYISSAGLRVLLATYRSMSSKGRMKVINANEIVREVFAVTGFTEILTIE